MNERVRRMRWSDMSLFQSSGSSDFLKAKSVVVLWSNFLEKSGWRADLPAVVEVRLPENYDYAAVDLDFSQWRSLGVTQANGESLPKSGAASLYFPAGALGPCFLISENFEVIRKYNLSDAYALSVTLLAERIAGRSTPFVKPRTKNEATMLAPELPGPPEHDRRDRRTTLSRRPRDKPFTARNSPPAAPDGIRRWPRPGG